MKIMVSFKVDDGYSTFLQFLQLLKNRNVVGEMEVFVSQPEFKEVSEDIESFRVTFQSGKELDHGPVVIVLRVLQVGICKENLSHGTNIYEKRTKVKDEAVSSGLTCFEFGKRPFPSGNIFNLCTAYRHKSTNQERFLNGFYAGCGNNLG